MQIDSELVESLKEDEAVSVLFSRLGSEYPNLLQALVLERDLFLAWSLKRSKVIHSLCPPCLRPFRFSRSFSPPPTPWV